MTLHARNPDATPVHQDEFWGEQSEWTPQRRPSAGRSGLGSTIGRWWDGLLGGAGAERTRGDGHRAHGRSSAPSEPIDRSEDRPRNDAGHDSAMVDDDAPADAAADAWTFEPEPQPVRSPGADPLLTRLGGLAVFVTLAAPLLLGFASSGPDSQSVDSLATIASAPIAEPAALAVTPTSDTAGMATTGAATPAPAEVPPTASPAGAIAPDASAATPLVSATADTALLEAVPEPATTTPATTTPATTAPATTTPATTAPACGKQYELAAGDYWIRIADAADVSLSDLLEVNDSTVDTLLVPGRSICLPVGASTPPPPPTTLPTTLATTVPATTVLAAPAARAPTTMAPSRSAPSTVAPTSTTQATPARPAAVPVSQATAIIRQVWPDDLEERALEIAWRESNHKSNVNNFCCYGLFQIYYSVHRSWLSTIGVDSAQDLFDPQLNAQAAYMLYQRAGGFGPWGG